MKYTYNDYRAFFYIYNAFLIDSSKGYMRIKERWLDFGESIHLIKSPKNDRTEQKIKKDFQTLRKQLLRLSRVPKGVKAGSLQQNLLFLQKRLNLSNLEVSILELLILGSKNPILKMHENTVNFSHGHKDISDLEEFMGEDRSCISKAMRADSPLQRYGLITGSYSVKLSLSIAAFLNGCFRTEQDRIKALVGKTVKSSWSTADFAYMPETDFAVKIMQNIGQKHGINILLYGAPGTGKTSFAQMLANACKRDLYPVGENANGRDERNYRLQDLYLKTAMVNQAKNACLFFDEAEDIFSSIQTRCNKAELNRLLENNPCPVIWATNDIDRMDPAYIRRFTLAIHFEQPPVSVRQKMWTGALKQHHLPHSKVQTVALAKEFQVPPSMIAGAAQAAGMVKGNLDTVRQHIGLMQQALNGGIKEWEEKDTIQGFNPALLRTDVDLDTLTKQLKKLGRMNFSLCLYGASGTGKSAYARYLAQELGLEVQQERASDLISAYVGGTEHNIAKAFARAQEEKSLLIFDEADTFLQDRTKAVRSWEVSSVNEMLTWMERHPYPFICTTNLMERLDAASLRRFSFKVKYDYLTAQQVQQAFGHFFRLKLTAQEAAEFTRLAPGDFALIKNKAELLGILKDKEALKAQLRAEQNLKSYQGGTGPIGFCAQ